jgi:mono/diheme cytochrome c family protein
MRLRTLALAALVLTGCRQDMHDQPRYEALEASDFFPDGRSSRDPVPGTVARGQLREDDVFETGRDGENDAETFPAPVVYLTPGQRTPPADWIVINRGQERYDIFCAPCHGAAGRGNGMVALRGYRNPPSLHIDRLRNERPGYLFGVITRGFGAMPDYAAQISTRDRWAIVAYIRALQLSQNATLADVPIHLRSELREGRSE